MAKGKDWEKEGFKTEVENAREMHSTATLQKSDKTRYPYLN